ncbi:MAG: 50S ribosomal protein L7/L12 [Proteobacteria bacterium]|nr:50S ribosomal protein L7/L12 [Pseudomonadota bacterium]
MVTKEQVIAYLESLNIIELNALVKELEEKWDVKAASGGGVVMAAAAPVAVVEEPTEFKVILADVGANKINVIKEIRALTGLGLKEAKDLVDGAPSTIKEGIEKAEAEDIKKKIEATGAKVDIKA